MMKPWFNFLGFCSIEQATSERSDAKYPLTLGRCNVCGDWVFMEFLLKKGYSKNIERILSIVGLK